MGLEWRWIWREGEQEGPRVLRADAVAKETAETDRLCGAVVRVGSSVSALLDLRKQYVKMLETPLKVRRRKGVTGGREVSELSQKFQW